MCNIRNIPEIVNVVLLHPQVFFLYVFVLFLFGFFFFGAHLTK